MTRQWLAKPSLMCIKHLTGEHAETHMFLSKMHQGHSLDGFIEGHMFFGAEYVKFRHDLLSLYLGGHSTPLEIETTIIKKYPLIMPTMDALKVSLGTLLARCEYCQSKHVN